MFLETFVLIQLNKAHKKYKIEKERYYDEENYDSESRDMSAASVTILSVLWLFMVGMWIFSIVSAARCPKPNAGEIVLAVFFWPLYWILKWGKTMCK